MNVTLRLWPGSRVGATKFERTRAPPEARAGDFEIIADDALAFVKAATIFARRKSLLFRPSLLSIQFEIDFYVVVIAFD